MLDFFSYISSKGMKKKKNLVAAIESSMEGSLKDWTEIPSQVSWSKPVVWVSWRQKCEIHLNLKSSMPAWEILTEINCTKNLKERINLTASIQ